MGRLLAAIGFLGFAFPSLAGEVPHYLGEVKGTLLVSLFERGRIELVPGDANACFKAEASGYVVYRCDDLRGATARLAPAAGPEQTVVFKQVLVEHNTLSEGKGVLQTYHFRGTWKEGTLETPVEVVLWNYRHKAGELKGHVKLTDHGVFAAVTATQR